MNEPEARVRYSPEERFWAKVTIASESECWIWTAGLSPQGYGSFWVGPATFTTAHRYSYTLAHGDPGPMVVDHVCHNESDCTEAPCLHRRCVNPAHLEAVTQLVNSRRGRTGSHNSEKARCPSGHEYSDTNTIARHDGGRRCRVCNLAAQRRYNLKRKATA